MSLPKNKNSCDMFTETCGKDGLSCNLLIANKILRQGYSSFGYFDQISFDL